MKKQYDIFNKGWPNEQYLGKILRKAGSIIANQEMNSTINAISNISLQNKIHHDYEIVTDWDNIINTNRLPWWERATRANEIQHL